MSTIALFVSIFIYHDEFRKFRDKVDTAIYLINTNLCFF